MTKPKRVVVVGGGLTGLATALHLIDSESFDVTVLEASERLGGEIQTVMFEGERLDVGADAFLARQPEGEALIRQLGFTDDDLVAPDRSQVALWADGRIYDLPAATVLGVPTDVRSVQRSGVLSAADRWRVASEPFRPRSTIHDDHAIEHASRGTRDAAERGELDDCSVASLVGARFGRQVVERLVEPLLGGVYAGRADQLSARYALAPVWQALATERGTIDVHVRSLTRALRRARSRPGDGTPSDRSSSPVFLTVRGSLGRVVDALAGRLGSSVRTRAGVVGIRPGDTARYELDLGDGSHVAADLVVIAVNAAATARLLPLVAPETSRLLARQTFASVGVITLAYDSLIADRLAGHSGVLVPRPPSRGERLETVTGQQAATLIKAVTLSSHKWPHRTRSGSLIRASVGRIDDNRFMELTDGELIARVERELQTMLGMPARSRAALVTRWPQALPQYVVGHGQWRDQVRMTLDREAPGVIVGGASYDGVGLSARCRDAEQLAQAIVQSGVSRQQNLE
ncbi:MAG: protoporphyrinogen oxidase [Nitriliruptoraceae bacterium]